MANLNIGGLIMSKKNKKNWKDKSIMEEADELAKMTVKGMSAKEKEFWRKVFEGVDSN